MAPGITYSSDNVLAWAISITAVITLVLIWPLFFLRVYVRAFVVRSFGLDDWFMGLSVLMHIMILFFILEYIFLKLSLGFQFLRLLTATWERLILYSAVLVTTVLGTVHFFFFLFFCGVPQHYAIVLFTQPQKCHSEKADTILQYLQVTTSMAFDLIVVALPLRHVIITPSMNVRTKLTVSGILLLGVGGLIATIVRLVRLSDIYDVEAPQTGTVGALVSAIEPALFVIGGCLGTLRPLVAKTLKITQKTGGSTRMSNASTIAQGSISGSVWNKTPALPPVEDETEQA
ncbi:hypothetical protein BT63DRAFT_453653 [Microthyrium microscopicum]|uniref:Rhodopsin domain-containing protein n=1 Tax=Microthyrium microscopicum TaxID=703497 RepID=A0A6A6UK39_9PEZI|nr:hypothetical protein BT63DRAFT_453653 [Microthyrium microscopicum]